MQDLSVRQGPMSHRHRYEDQGFSDDEREPEVIVAREEDTYVSANLLQVKKARPRFHEPKTKLKFIAHEKVSRSTLQNSIIDKECQNRKNNARSLEYRNKDHRSHLVLPTMQPITKSKRTLIGENFSIPAFAMNDTRSLKAALISSAQALCFEAPRQNNTHGFLRRFMEKKPGKRGFLDSRMNTLLRERLRESFVMPKKGESVHKGVGKVVFNSEIESGNLELAARASDNEYDLYLRIDTNTHGHQNWFHFQASSTSSEEETFTFNICNMKRDFKLVHRGQKVFVKEIDSEGNEQGWVSAGDNISIKENTNPRIGLGRVYKLTFQLLLKPGCRYQMAMLPAYTYSDMINYVQELQKKHPKLVSVEILNYSMIGLAIPIVTITNRESKQDKKAVLVSCRIHPGETVASYVGEGLMDKLVEMEEMLKSTVFKIIPILNPDGVVLGNFRTNYLGIDLNRAFVSEDEILNPEINSLKEVGRALRNEFGGKFLYFFDLHGHSSHKNIFSYGPSYEYNDPQFYASRILPKVLHAKSKYFNYNSCTFTLQEHKKHTARGFFLSELNVMTYTIESSYSMYDNPEGVETLFEVKDWVRFGRELAESCETVFKLRDLGRIKTNKELKKLLNENEQEQVMIMKNIKQDIKREIKEPASRKVCSPDSDADSDHEDLTQEERRDIDKKVLESCLPNFTLPRVLKPAILYPTVTPKLFEVNEERDQGSFKVLYTKRNKYNTLRMVNANGMYANYLKNLEELDRFKPMARNIKLEKKLDV